jgi:hypothetical protein
MCPSARHFLSDRSNKDRAKFPDAHFNAWIHFYLGIDPMDAIDKAKTTIKCECKKVIEQDLITHLLCCDKFKRTTITNRHDHVARVIQRFAKEVLPPHATVTLEPRLNQEEDGTRLRPDLMVDTLLGVRIVADVAIIHPIAESHLKSGDKYYRNIAHTKPYKYDHSISAMEDMKGNKYKAMLDKEGSLQLPAVLSSYGSIFQDSTLDKFLDMIIAEATAQKALTPDKQEYTKQRIVRKIANAVHLGNASIIVRGLAAVSFKSDYNVRI